MEVDLKKGFCVHCGARLRETLPEVGGCAGFGDGCVGCLTPLFIAAPLVCFAVAIDAGRARLDTIATFFFFLVLTVLSCWRIVTVRKNSRDE